MVRLFHVHLPTRTLLLAVAEAFIVVGLLFATVAVARDQAWLWLRYDNGFARVGLVAAIFLLCMYYYDLYDSMVLKSLREALTRLPGVLGTACLLLAALYLMAPAIRLRLASVLLSMALAGLGVALIRRAYRSITHSPQLAERFVLAGDGALARALAVEIEHRPELGIRLVAQTSVDGPAYREAESLASVLIRNRATGVILIAERSGKRSFPASAGLREMGAEILDGVEFFEIITGKVWTESLDPEELPAARAVRASPVLLVGKRLASIALSLVGLIAAAPLMALIAIAIHVDSGGPVIFRQQRVGQYGKLFTLYKFRSMRNGNHGPFRPARENDERCTRIGHWLRRTRMDELPQLWNVLRGDMSFVGPRPFACEEERQLARTIPFYTQRWCVKPGATGWAQIHRGYCATIEDNREKLAYDLFYIKNLSLGMDLLILLQTTKILLQGRGAR